MQYVIYISGILFCSCATEVFQFRVVGCSVSFGGRFTAHCCFWPPKEHCCHPWHGWEVWNIYDLSCLFFCINMWACLSWTTFYYMLSKCLSGFAVNNAYLWQLYSIPSKNANEIMSCQWFFLMIGCLLWIEVSGVFAKCSFYRCEFDPIAGGEMIQLEHHNFLKPEESF